MDVLKKEMHLLSLPHRIQINIFHLTSKLFHCFTKYPEIKTIYIDRSITKNVTQLATFQMIKTWDLGVSHLMRKSKFINYM